MKFKKLNEKGFSHTFIMLAVVVVVAIAGVGYIVASHAETPCTKRVFRQGSRGECVRVIQYITTHHQYHARPLHPDGVFGSRTKAAVVHYQKYWGLKSDGVVGRSTWSKICSDARFDLLYKNDHT